MYNKLFTKILDSTIWLEDDPTRLVWITMLAQMDEDGFVQLASAGNVANRARVPLDATRKALATLEAPDPSHVSQDHEGRRIEAVPGGWMVLNAAKYRDIVRREVSKEQNRARVERFRRLKAECNASVMVSHVPVTTSDTDTDALPETLKAIALSGLGLSIIKAPKVKTATREPAEFTAFWQAYPRKTAKGRALKAWGKLPAGVTFLQIMGALGAQTWEDPKFIPHPATWLNDQRWLDQPVDKLSTRDYGRCEFCPEPAVGENHGHRHCGRGRCLDSAGVRAK